MQMIRQHHPAMDVERMGAAYHTDCFTQFLDMPDQEIVIAAPQQSEREEVGSARMPDASVIGHGTMISSPCIRRNTLRYCALPHRLAHKTSGDPAAPCIPQRYMFKMRPCMSASSTAWKRFPLRAGMRLQVYPIRFCATNFCRPWKPPAA